MFLLKAKKGIVYLIIFVSCIIPFQTLTATNAECKGDKPPWPKEITSKNVITKWLLDTLNDCENSEVEYSSYDGWYHNLAKLDLGSVEQPLLRGWAAIRIDGSLAKNWSKAWNEIMSVTSVCKTKLNALSLFFSKQVVDEMLDTKNPSCVSAEYLERHNKEQVNYASPYIDGGIIYGKSRHLILLQIVLEDGTIDIDRLSDLKIEKGNYDDLYISSVLKIIWLRWHNHIAKQISEICRKWTSEKIFKEARKWTIAVQQRIYAYEWLPLWTAKDLPKYSRYDPTVEPQVTKLFQAAMAIPQSIYDIKYPFFHTTVDNTESIWLNYSTGINKLLQNLTLVPCANITTFEEIEHITEKYDLPAINHARNVFNLDPYSNWKNFLTKNKLNTMLFSTLVEENLQRLDAMMGGTLESKHGPGELFLTVIHDQFRRIRDGDRFWFENMRNNLFSCKEVVKIGQTTFADVLLTVTNLDLEDLKNNSVFTTFKSNGVHLEYFHHSRTTNPFNKSSDILFFPKTDVYIIPFLLMGVICIGTIGVAACINITKQIKKRNLIQKEYSVTKQALQDDWQMRYPLFPVKEYTGVKKALKRVVVILKKDKKQITIQSFSGTVLRVINFDILSKTDLKVIILRDESTLIIQFPHNYDLVLKFESNYLRTAFTTELDLFVESNAKLQKELITSFTWKTVKSIIVTKEHRQMWLEMFFRVAFAQAFKIQHSVHEMLQVDAFVAKEVIYTELTIVEFADALSMHPDNEFVKRMFTLVDKDKNGFISFREFVDLIIIFAEGSKERKAKLLFDLYDINGTGLIPAKDFSAMIKSFLETVGGRFYNVDAQKTIAVMLRSAGMEKKKNLDFDDFKKIIGDDIKNLTYAKLGFKLQKQDDSDSYLALAKRTIEAMYRKSDDLSTRFQNFTQIVDQKQADTISPPVQQTRLYSVLLFFELHSKQLFWMVLLTLLIVFVFLEKVYHINKENEPSGINRYIFGPTRGAKNAMVITYALLLITMCRNIWTKLRDLLANKYFPFDHLVQIHIYVACLSAAFTVSHAVGEILIFYEVILTSDDLACILKKYLMNEETTNIHMMFWLNSVVITGFTLFLLLSIVYVFAQSHVRQKFYNFFYFTHNLYPVIIILVIIHGSQSPIPLAPSVMSVPLILFIADLFVSLKRKKIELPVLRAELFPSDVICLVLRRPENFQYKVGQWVRLAVPQISRQEFHSVSLSAAPHEPYLRIYIRPTNRWSCQVYSLFEGPGSGYAAAPVRVLLDGPYGGGAQYWRLYDVVVLVGGGSGVAPFAAILKDLSHALQTKEYLHCQKVYFIWVSKTQRHFEWIVDLIQDTEDKDLKHYLSSHIFITQFYEKFDLRTIMLYICEKHYQRISGKSLFTNLRAVTHFGRPAFPEFFKTIQSLHPTAKHVGVFSSGPASLSRAVDAACSHLTSQSDQRFEHHSNNL